MIRAFFYPPVFASQEKTRRAQVLFALIWTNSLAGIVSMLGIMVMQRNMLHAMIFNLSFLLLSAAALLALAHRGWITTASWLLIDLRVAATSLRSLNSGGIHSPGVTLFFVYALMAGLLLGETAGIATAMACAAIGLGLVVAERQGLLPVQTAHFDSLTYWWIGCFYMCLVIYLLRLATQTVNRALACAEAELADKRKTEQHLSIALKAAAIGIWDGDLRSTHFWADERTAAVMGIPRAEDGTIALETWRGIVHPDDLQTVTSNIARMIEEEAPQGKIEYRLVLPSGEIRHVEATGAPVRDQNGAIVSHAGTVIDITARKEAEAERALGDAQRRSLEKQLLQVQKREALGTLASGIAHDFNNLLGAIRGFAGILEEDTAPGSQSRRFAERISAACGRGKDIVNQILTFARTGSQQQQDIELSELLRECEALLANLVAGRAGVTFSGVPQEVYMRGNAGQLVQLVTNLCVNAAESSDAASGRIEVQLDLPDLAGAFEAAESRRQQHSHCIGNLDGTRRYVRIRVSDNGSGIAPDILQQIFDPFFTTKGRQRGSGLGLSVCQGVVEGHDGFCLVESELGKGTCFSIFFPILGQAPQRRASLPVATRTIRGSERVLVVDDEPDIADWLTIGLGRLGYDVSSFNAPLKALTAFRESPAAWDIVIADQIMPHMRGAEFLELVKAENPHVLTVLCSGHREADASQMQKMAELCLAKPIALAELSASIRAMLDTRTAR